MHSLPRRLSPAVLAFLGVSLVWAADPSPAKKSKVKPSAPAAVDSDPLAALHRLAPPHNNTAPLRPDKDMDDDTIVPMEFPLHYAEARPLKIYQKSDDTDAIVIPGVADTLLKMTLQPGDDGATRTGGVPDVYPHQTHNSVIVLDKKSHHDFYRDLVCRLDQKRQMIEISVAIIDIDSNTALELGTELFGGTKRLISEGTSTMRFSSFGGDKRVGNLGGVVDGFNPLVADPLNANVVEGGPFSIAGAIASGNSTYVARFKALEQQGKARVMTRPSILTLSGMEATFSDESRLFVSVPGVNFANLYEVPVASRIKVIPRVAGIGPQANPMVQMVVMVDDAANTASATVNGSVTPVVASSSVTTQAVVAENGSLLLGGRFRQSQTQDDAHVPVLGRIPLIGLLFKQKSGDKSRAQRFFLISPRLVDPAQLKHNDGNEVYWGYDPQTVEEARRQATAPPPDMDDSPATTQDLRQRRFHWPWSRRSGS
ncbi:MAG: EscC/YscC/HrcC family type secretion system outer rane ring protein [Verrucomicrobiaceae bacterium]|nr:EscC/YscC/HrcC family type secretion system outer rane ring protein [Verrucomicrobiaceae bacterium]